MYKLHISSIENDLESFEISFDNSITVYDALVMAGVELKDSSCGGNHTCGKCIVYVNGSTFTPTSEEHKLIVNQNIEQKPFLGHARLACLTIATGDCEIYYQPGTKSVPTESNKDISITSNISRVGVAIDIGTTTLEISFIDLDSTLQIYQYRELNNQKLYGSDVLSRIDYSNKNGKDILHKQISDQISEAISDICLTLGISIEIIECMVVSGNTTMLHFFSNQDPKGIGVYPFTADNLFGIEVSANEILSGFTDANSLYIADCIGPYIGGDISCGIIHANMLNSNGVQLLIDVGTNGEIVLAKNNNLYCCSTAAGPAFEGAQIAMGMIAAPGAINMVYYQNGDICYTTIDEVDAVGLCGSGIISAIETLISLGIVDATGRISEVNHPFSDRIVHIDSQVAVYIVKDKIYLTQQDIRNVQLAKAAVAAGIETLLQETSTDVNEITKLFLAGGFGSGINAASAAAIGLIPAALADKVTFIGNSSLEGAKQLLESMELKQTLKGIVNASTELSLSSSGYFMEKYIDNMSFTVPSK
ncbi:MAG: ASKHA domain-containing protein [Oscillospiraceae bacterium]|nr:ASKHA domain-containing protein [Oscillospiraceae bacterium]